VSSFARVSTLVVAFSPASSRAVNVARVVHYGIRTVTHVVLAATRTPPASDASSKSLHRTTRARAHRMRDSTSVRSNEQSSSPDTESWSLTVIIPALNEVQRIERAIASAKNTTNEARIIVVDGGSSDGTPKAAKRTGVDVVRGARGRAVQMNMGARRAASEYLVFLHADCALPAKYGEIIANEFTKRRGKRGTNPEWGAFAFKLSREENAESDVGTNLRRRAVEIGTNLRCAVFGTPYGDQGLVIKRETFTALGGFDEMPFMEDYAMVKKLRARSAPVLLSAPVIASARRWDSRGFVRVTLVNQLIILGYHCGVAIEKLADLYRKL